MKKYITFIIMTLVMAVILFEVIIFSIIMVSPGRFYTSYQSVIVDKYRMLQKTDEPKIIIVSGSSSAFGLDQALLEAESGYKVVNLGLHNGFGPMFYTELSKENINAGDIVLLGYEYGWPECFETMDQSLIMTGIDENIDMYKHIPPDHWRDFIGYVFKYANMKFVYDELDMYGPYSRESFDPETAQMTLYREYESDALDDPEKVSQLVLEDMNIPDDVLEYLLDYKEYMEHRGAEVFFIAPPVMKSAVKSNYSEFDEFANMVEESIGIPYISDPKDYFMDDNLMYDSLYHCNTEGERVRTLLLIDDLRKAGII